MDDIIRPDGSSRSGDSFNQQSHSSKTQKLSHAALEAMMAEETDKEKEAAEAKSAKPTKPGPDTSSDSGADTGSAANSTEPKPAKKPRRSFKEWLKFRHSQLSKKQKILLIAACILLIVGGGVGAYYLHKHLTKVPVSKASIVKPKPKPKIVVSRLTGLPIDPSLANRPVTGVMIENSPDARPQSGLLQAGVVYEAIAEGGITRFLALYEEAQPDYIGPIRSVRPYYLDFLMPFDAPIAHVGGAPQALSDIKTLGVKDLDQFYNSAYYTRITTRYAPHNVYTSIAELDKAEAAKGYTSSTFTGFNRKKDAPSKAPTARTIDIAISASFYNVHYDYDPAANAYKRSEGGAPHTDEKSGTQLEPKVVVTLVMSRGIASDGEHTDYGTTGSGQMMVFQDGVVTTGTWNKADRKSQFTFTDSAGKPIKFNAGQTWITITDAGATTYKP